MGNIQLQTYQNTTDNRNLVSGSENSNFNKILKLYMISDAISLLLGLACACGFAALINNILLDNDKISVYNFHRFSNFIFVSVGVLLWLAHSGHYRVRMPFWQEAHKIVNTLGFALLIDGFFEFSTRHDASRLLIISGWVFAAIAMIATRSAVRYFAVKNETFAIPTLLIGAGATAKQAREAISSAPELGYDIVAHIKNLPDEFMQVGRSWKNLCAKYKVEYVMIALDGEELTACEKMMKKLMRETIPFSVCPPIQNLPVMGMMPQYFFNHDMMLLTRTSGLEQPIPRFIKRLFDIVVSGTALLLLSPIMLCIGMIIKTDGGAALFGHKRIGKGGKIFPCWKFRSMIMNGDVMLKKHLAENPEAAAEWNATQKLQYDPRVTKIGKILRVTSIDELPQLINVLKGEMSLVGPRPIVHDEVRHYNYDIAHYHRVRPGVTGLWQVSGRNDVSYAKRVEMDSWYVRNWSLWHDIAILCKTVPAVFKRSGAY